jgi:non-canonical poly(A) RNA polymerase PAPD5/7
VCVLKYFLKQRGLSETYNGGVGSYLLFCMSALCSSTLQGGQVYSSPLSPALLPPLWRPLQLREGGSLQGHYFDKLHKGWLHTERRSLLALECPQNQENDLGRNSFSIDLVKKAFSHAYKIICACGVSRQTTPLQTIIRLDPVLASRVL